MRVVEHRRHTMRVKPGDRLSQAGVDLARRVGETMGRYDLVVTSPVARASETAIAMSFAVDETTSGQFGSLDSQPLIGPTASHRDRPVGPAADKSGGSTPGALSLIR